MAVTTNVDATADYTLVKSGPTNGMETVGYKGIPIEIVVASSTPSEDFAGQRVGPGSRGFSLQAGENLYARAWRNLARDDDNQVVLN